MSARGLVLDDNSLVREALRFVLTHLELHAVYLHQGQLPLRQRTIYGAPCALQTVPSRIARRAICRRSKAEN